MVFSRSGYSGESHVLRDVSDGVSAATTERPLLKSSSYLLDFTEC